MCSSIVGKIPEEDKYEVKFSIVVPILCPNDPQQRGTTPLISTGIPRTFKSTISKRDLKLNDE